MVRCIAIPDTSLASITPNDGPYFDDLTVGHRFEPAPAITITGGMASAYQAIVGDPLAPTLSTPLAQAVCGDAAALANPALVLSVSIGQSTVATRRVIANLFYRGVSLRTQPRLGATLTTEVEVRGMREATRRPDRPPRGLVLLAMETRDEHGTLVAAYERCALLPFRDAGAETDHHDDLGSGTDEFDPAAFAAAVPSGWQLAPLGPPDPWPIGQTRVDPLADTVSSALELVRLTQNQAAVHRDARLSADGRRLVYGGHTIGLAQASLARMVPSAAYVVGWVGCDHVAPVYEGDLLTFTSTLDAIHDTGNGRLLCCTVDARTAANDELVLRWLPVVYAP